MANALDYYGDPDTTETRKFVRNFDRFFDCLNVRCTQEGIQKRKPDLRPYRDPSDSRLTVSVLDPSHTHKLIVYQLLWVILSYGFQWLKEGFLGYLDDWERSVNSREGFTSAQRNMMLLSQQTIEGLRITGE